MLTPGASEAHLKDERAVVGKDTMFRPAPTGSHTTQPTSVPMDVAAGGALPASICTISIRRYSGWSAVILRGELDRPSVAEIRAAVATELGESRRVLIELVGLEFSDLDGVRALADLVRHGERRGGDGAVEVHGARDQVARLITLVGLEHVLGSG